MSELNKIYKEIDNIKFEASGLIELANAFQTVGNDKMHHQLTIIAECICEYSDNIRKLQYEYIDNEYNKTMSETADIMNILINNEKKNEV